MISVVVRILNERENLRKLLDALKTQKCSIPFEIIVVDNESTDGTKELALSYGVKIVTLARNDFSYPKAMNLGIRNCSGEYVVLTVGHALPFSNNWLETVIENFKDKKNAGIYGGQKPRTNADPLEFITYGYWYLRDILKGKRLVKKGPGILGATNCAIRKSLWEKHYFNEYYECGGEDGEWAKWAIKEGYNIVFDPKFSVRHSHSMKSFADRKKQFAYWKNLDKPTKFTKDSLVFRKDLNLQK